MASTTIQTWTRYTGSALLAAVLLAGVVSCDDNCTSLTGPHGTFTIISQADADALSNCSTISGNIFIQSDTVSQITLDGIQTIDGSLAASSSDELQTITAPLLSQITENFTLSSLLLLTTLNFPLLDNVNNAINWDTLPVLTEVWFGNLTASPHDLPGTNVDGDISILSTGLSSLVFLNFTHYSTPDLIWIKGNQQLYSVNLTGLSWGSNDLVIVNNGPRAQISLPNLKSGGAITISDASQIDISSLSETTSDLLISNNFMDVFSAPNLTAIGGDFVVSNNSLNDLELPLLTTIGDAPGGGDFIVANNTGLDTIMQLNRLWSLLGTISLSGDFSNVTLPNIHSVIDGFHLNSSNPTFDCTDFDKLADQYSWNSSFYSCGAYIPGSMKDVAKHYYTPSSGLISKPVKAILVIVSVILGLLVFGLTTRWWSRRKARARRRGSEGQAEGDVVSLGSVGVSRRTTGETDGLPQYSRVGKPGEVPPRYIEAETETVAEVREMNT